MCSVAFTLGYRTTILALSGYRAPTRVKMRSEAESTKGGMAKSRTARKRRVLIMRLRHCRYRELVGSEKSIIDIGDTRLVCLVGVCDVRMMR